VERDPSQLTPQNPNAPPVFAPVATKKETPVQGIFIIDPTTMTAVFTPATTGITGVDHIQVLSGIKAGQEVVTGPYSALRSLANHARIKVDNSLQAQAAAAAANSNN
ncbi:MAG: efflux RND transporter periplasmic adaptor subunit, partial [Terriglobales bacterium]